MTHLEVVETGIYYHLHGHSIQVLPNVAYTIRTVMFMLVLYMIAV